MGNARAGWAAWGAACLLLPLAAQAQEPAVRVPDLLVLGAGASDVFGRQQYLSADFRAEYRSGVSLLSFLEPYAPLRPWAGIEVTGRGAVWAGGGVLFDIPIGRFSLVPQAGIGGYAQNGGKPLGSGLEFRTGVELAYRFDDSSRLGVMFNHISNAGVTRRNPGTEAIVVNYQIPLSRLFGR